MAEKIDILDAYFKAFGAKHHPSLGYRPVTVWHLPNFIPIKTIKSASPDGSFIDNMSMLGTPYFMPLKLDGKQMPNEPIIELSGGKSIIKTPIDGNEGTFKESYSLGDYHITIRGICVNEGITDEYPHRQVRMIRDIIEKKVHISCVCKLLGYFNIKHLAIEDFKFPAIEGCPSMQPYELTCLSDKFFDLELLEGTV